MPKFVFCVIFSLYLSKKIEDSGHFHPAYFCCQWIFDKMWCTIVFRSCVVNYSFQKRFLHHLSTIKLKFLKSSNISRQILKSSLHNGMQCSSCYSYNMAIVNTIKHSIAHSYKLLGAVSILVCWRSFSNSLCALPTLLFIMMLLI